MATGKKYFIKSDLASRWGVPRQTVNSWEKRNPNEFPEPEFWLGNNYMPVYKLEDIEAYEQQKGITPKNI